MNSPLQSTKQVPREIITHLWLCAPALNRKVAEALRLETGCEADAKRRQYSAKAELVLAVCCLIRC